jgi:hypothetical protein
MLVICRDNTLDVLSNIKPEREASLLYLKCHCKKIIHHIFVLNKISRRLYSPIFIIIYLKNVYLLDF